MNIIVILASGTLFSLLRYLNYVNRSNKCTLTETNISNLYPIAPVSNDNGNRVAAITFGYCIKFLKRKLSCFTVLNINDMKFSEGIEFGAQISKYRLKMEDVEVVCIYIILRKLCGLANR